MKVEVTEGKVLVESVSVYKVNDTWLSPLYVLIDFKSKRPELLTYSAGNPAQLEFGADDGTLRTDPQGDPFTVIRIYTASSS